MMATYAATPGTKMQFLIARRPGVTREELMVNWFATHMPAAAERQRQMADRNGTAAPRYVATLFDAVQSGAQVWDGVAQMWATAAFPREQTPYGTEPTDTFQEKALPYASWPTTEYVIVDGELPVTPNSFGEPFPATRGGFLKVTTLLKARAGIDLAALHEHWLDVHGPNVAGAMQRAGAFRFVISLSDEPDVDPYVGMAELYFPDKQSLKTYLAVYRSDGVEKYFDTNAALYLRSQTEMIGIPG